MTDHHCKELYRCYKCVNIDYAKNYTDVSYNVDFNTDEAGNRQLDCKVNSKQDAENICECDKRFAENIAATVDSCNVRIFQKFSLKKFFSIKNFAISSVLGNLELPGFS